MVLKLLKALSCMPFFFLLNGNVSFDIEKKTNPMSGEQLINLALDTWTYIDIIRAIYTTESQREEFLDNIVDRLVRLYLESKKSTQCTKINPNEISMLCQLVADMKEHYYEIFSKNMLAYNIGSTVLDSMPLVLSAKWPKPNDSRIPFNNDG